MSTYSAGNKIERIATDNMSTKTNIIYDYTSFFNMAIKIRHRSLKFNKRE